MATSQHHNLTAGSAVLDALNRSQIVRGADLASASTISPPLDVGDYFHLTGVATVNHVTITSMLDGRVIELYATSTVQIAHNTASPPAGTVAIILTGLASKTLGPGAPGIRLRYDAGINAVVEIGNGGMGGVDTVVANITALKALDVSLFASGHRAWVETKKTLYAVDKLATGVAGDDNFHVRPTAAPTFGMWVRLLMPVPEWQLAAVNGTGIFIHPGTGNDENVGTSSGFPIKTVAEFNARMWFAEFATAPRLTTQGDSAVAKDAVFTGWRTAPGVVAQFIGTQVNVATGVVLSAAGDLNPPTAAGFMTSTITDFQTLGYKSTPTRTLWARRNNTSGGSTTYAPLYRTHNSGGNFSVDIGIQFQTVTGTWGNPVVTTQALAAADVVDLITLTSWTGFQVDRGISLAIINIEVVSGGTIEIAHGGATTAKIFGTRGLVSVISTSGSFNAFGFMLIGFGVVRPATSTLRYGVLGAQGISEAIITASGNLTLQGATLDTARIESVGGYVLWSTAGSAKAWVEQSSRVLLLDQGARGVAQDGMTIGLGSAVANAVAATDGSGFSGSEHFDESVNTFTAATPWQVGEDPYTDDELDDGLFDNETGSWIAAS